MEDDLEDQDIMEFSCYSTAAEVIKERKPSNGEEPPPRRGQKIGGATDFIRDDTKLSGEIDRWRREEEDRKRKEERMLTES